MIGSTAKRMYRGSRVGLHAAASSPGRISSNVMARAVSTVNESVAPVCPISRGETPPAQPGIKLPSVPLATDLESAIKAINTIAAIMNDENSEPFIRWLEKYRVTAIVRIFNPDDDSQWVDVERIMKLVMEDQENGDLWVWELEHPSPPAPGTPGVIINNAEFNADQNKWIVMAKPPGT